MLILIIQENGRHDRNRNFRECFCAQRAFHHYGHRADVWGLGHSNYDQIPDYNAYDVIINLENYDETGWVPNLKQVKATKFLWAIDAHVKGIDGYLKTANEGDYDLILQATNEFVGAIPRSIWFPNCYDDEIIKPINTEKKYNLGFCGNIVNRGNLIKLLQDTFNLKLDEFVIGPDMVEAINSYKVHFNANIGIDINYRNFETLGCGTCLLTSYNSKYERLGMIDGVNCLVYKNIQEMLEKVKFALENDEARTIISNNGLVLAEQHTYKKRINYLLSLL